MIQGPSRLPERASLDYLKKLAKQRLRELRLADPGAKLATAQLTIAREYGFPSWRALKAEVDKQRAPQLDPFFRAVAERDFEAMRRLLDEDPSLANERHASGSTPLHELVGYPDMVRLLLAKGADPNARDVGDNATPLHFAAGSGAVESVRLLLDAGADVHGTGDVHHADVIGWAVGDGTHVHHDVVNLLLERGARHHIFSAIAVGDVSLVESLIDEHPENLTRRRSRFEQHQTPLHFALSAPDGLRTKPAQLEMAQLLIDLGADVDAADDQGRTPLAIAMLHGDVDAMRLLHAAGAKEPAAADLSRVQPNVDEIRASMARQVTPMLCVDDVPATVNWFTSVGFSLDEYHPNIAQMDWAALSLGKVAIMVQGRGTRPHNQIALWFMTTRIEELYEVLKQRQLETARAKLAGDSSAGTEIRFLENLYEPFYGGKQFTIADQNGFELVFQTM
jgi:ankyrin repeat protein